MTNFTIYLVKTKHIMGSRKSSSAKIIKMTLNLMLSYSVLVFLIPIIIIIIIMNVERLWIILNLNNADEIDLIIFGMKAVKPLIVNI